jgi:hypothetical protein
MNKHPQAKYNEAVVRVSAAIREADPEGLIRLGAPDDEYDGYAAEVARRLLHGDSIPELLFESYPDWQGRIPRQQVQATITSIQRELLES